MCWTSRIQKGEKFKPILYHKYPLPTQSPFSLSLDKNLNKLYSFLQFLLDITVVQFNAIFRQKSLAGKGVGHLANLLYFHDASSSSSSLVMISNSFTPRQLSSQYPHPIRAGWQKSKENQKKGLAWIVLLWSNTGLFWLWYSQGWPRRCTSSSWVIYLFLSSTFHFPPLEVDPQLLTALVSWFWQALLLGKVLHKAST